MQLVEKDFSPLQKCTTTIHILAYRSLVDSVNEYVRITECTGIQCLEAFVRDVNEILWDIYLGRPNNNDINRLLQIRETYGLTGMFDSIDCMHRKLKNCLVALQGQYCRSDHCKPIVILEGVP